MKVHASNSSEQQQAEQLMLELLEIKLGSNFNEDTHLPVDVNVKPDAIDFDKKYIVEIYAHIGKLKGAQKDKVMGDILKLILIEKILKEKWTKVLCFSDEAAADYVRGKSWVAEVVRLFDISVHTVTLPEEQLNMIKSAQKRQRMENQK